jgi:hypothetical protein
MAALVVLVPNPEPPADCHIREQFVRGITRQRTGRSRSHKATRSPLLHLISKAYAGISNSHAAQITGGLLRKNWIKCYLK